MGSPAADHFVRCLNKMRQPLGIANIRYALKILVPILSPCPTVWQAAH